MRSRIRSAALASAGPGRSGVTLDMQESYDARHIH
jgi:hypothetical protein